MNTWHFMKNIKHNKKLKSYILKNKLKYFNY